MSFAIFAMPSSSILLLFSIVLGGSEARPWTEAQQTHVYEADAWSPRPTAVPRGAEKFLRLFGRDSVDVAICGWIGGNSASAATCSAGSSCVRDIVHGVVGCCADTGPCTAGVYTGCVDMNSNGWTPNSGIQTNGVFTCSGTDLCYKNIFPGGYSQYGCGQTNMATSVETTYSGQPSDVLLQQVFTGVEFTATSPSASSSSSITTTSSSSSSSTSSSTSSSSSSSSTTSSSSTLSTVSSAPKQTGTSNTTPTAIASSSKKSHVGIIVGSVLGGLAGLAIIGALLFFLLHHRKKSRAGPFQSAHSDNQPPTSGPSQPLIPYQPYGPTDFDPRTGEMTTAAAVGTTGREHPTSYTYTEDGTPPDAHHQFYSSSQNQDELPLVQGSEIDDFSDNYHRAIGATVPREDTDTDIHSGEGLGLGVGGLSRTLTGRSGGGIYGNVRTQDRDLTDEPLRSPVGATVPGFMSEESWEATQRTERENSNPPPGNGNVPPRRASVRATGERAGMMGATVGGFGANLGRGASVLSAAVGRDNAPRYQLVDEIGDDVPVLGSSDRTLRGKKSVKWEEEG